MGDYMTDRPREHERVENLHQLFSDVFPFADQSLSPLERSLLRLKLTDRTGLLTETGKKVLELRKSLKISTRGARMLVEARHMEQENREEKRILIFPSLVLASYREQPDIFFWPDYDH